MRRIVDGEGVFYVQTHRFWAWVCFLSGCAIAAVGIGAWVEGQRAFALRAGAVGLVLWSAGLGHQIRRRIFLIDRGAGVLKIRGRRFWGRSFGEVLTLKEAEVILESREILHRGHRAPHVERVGKVSWIRISLIGREPIEVMNEIRGSDGPRLARALAEDMGRPLRVLDRTF